MKFNIFKGDPNTKSFSAGEIVFEAGQLDDVMYVIEEGQVEILYNDKVINTHGSGEIFGEMALIESKERSATAVAKSDCQLVPINKKRFTFLVQQNPFFALDVMKVLADRLRRKTE